MQFTYKLSNIDSVAKSILEQSQHKIFLLYGDLGAGKTTLVKAILHTLGVRETMSSPTFSLVNEYKSEKNERIFHFDFYRIQNSEEVLDIGFEEYLDQGDWIFIEWPKKIEEYIPYNTTSLIITATKPSERNCVVSNKC